MCGPATLNPRGCLIGIPPADRYREQLAVAKQLVRLQDINGNEIDEYYEHVESGQGRGRWLPLQKFFQADWGCGEQDRGDSQTR